MPRPEARTRSRKSPRWSAERRASRSQGTQGTPQGARPAALLQANRVPLHPGACRRSAHPSIGVATEEANSEYDVGRKEKGKKKKENGEEKMGRSEIRRVGKDARRTIDGLVTRSIACAVPTRSALSRVRTAWARRVSARPQPRRRRGVDTPGGPPDAPPPAGRPLTGVANLCRSFRKIPVVGK